MPGPSQTRQHFTMQKSMAVGLPEEHKMMLKTPSKVQILR